MMPGIKGVHAMMEIPGQDLELLTDAASAERTSHHNGSSRDTQTHPAKSAGAGVGHIIDPARNRHTGMDLPLASGEALTYRAGHSIAT